MKDCPQKGALVLTAKRKEAEMRPREFIGSRLRRHGRLTALIAAPAVIVAGLAVSGTAQAATNGPAHASAPVSQTATSARSFLEWSCFGKPHQLGSRYCFFQTENGHAPLYYPNNTLAGFLPLNDKVKLTCYYFIGNTIEDHVTWTQFTGYFTGHIPDFFINEGGSAPWAAPAQLPQC